jgi:hypothetical protein
LEIGPFFGVWTFGVWNFSLISAASPQGLPFEPLLWEGLYAPTWFGRIKAGAPNRRGIKPLPQ